MAKQYGGYVGNAPDVGSSSAPGSWTEPTEAFRQNRLTQWPIAPNLGVPFIDAGSYVYFLASGSSDKAAATGDFTIADGKSASTTVFSGIFDVIGYTYGGAGANFNVPNLLGDFKQHRSISTSGLALSAINLSGTLPQHKHSCNIGNLNQSQPGDDQYQQPGYYKGYNITPSVGVGFYGDPDGNVGRHRQVIPALFVNNRQPPVGALLPILLPIPDEDYAGILDPATLVIPSGQNLSRTEFADLFADFGTHFGTGDGSTTFGIPDMRGLFVKCNDGTGVSGVLGSGYVMDALARHQHDVTIPVKENSQNTRNGSNRRCIDGFGTAATGESDVGTDNETRPANISVIWVLVASV